MLPSDSAEQTVYRQCQRLRIETGTERKSIAHDQRLRILRVPGISFRVSIVWRLVEHRFVCGLSLVSKESQRCRDACVVTMVDRLGAIQLTGTSARVLSDACQSYYQRPLLATATIYCKPLPVRSLGKLKLAAPHDPPGARRIL